MNLISTLDVKLFADGADIAAIAAAADDPLIRGFTTNPTLMRQAGVDDYEQFALKALEVPGVAIHEPKVVTRDE